MTQVGFIFFAHTSKAMYNNICLLLFSWFSVVFFGVDRRIDGWTYIGLFLYVISTGVLSSVSRFRVVLCFGCFYLILLSSISEFIGVTAVFGILISPIHFPYTVSGNIFVCRENWTESQDKGGDGLWLIKLMFCMIRVNIYIFYDATQILLNQDMC